LSFPPSFLVKTGLLLVAAGIATATFSALLNRFEPRIDAGGREQAEFLDALPIRYVDLAIFGSAALSLFLELAVIRWQSTVFEFFAFYKNFGLLSCFAGLGLGYALSNQDRIPLSLAIPLLGWQFGLMIVLRFAMAPHYLETLRTLPFVEQLNMGVRGAGGFEQVFAVYFFLAVIFLLTALAFLPIGQLCGHLMERRGKWRAYGMNLLGSLFGVTAMFAASYLWTPPLVWFALCFAGILLLSPRQWSSLMLGIGFTVATMILLAWPVNPLWQRIYSPYQLLEVGHGENGFMLIRAAGHYYQSVHDLSPAHAVAEVDPKLKRIRSYYELPYRMHEKHTDVAIVGAGAGNDVAAALRSGAKRVDAIEIDPAILMLGKANHPERPYHDPRVRAIVNDARSFLRTTDKTYDMVVYGLLDSHTLLSHASSVRLDSFVYTVEALREARARLKEDGVLSLSFSTTDDSLGRKIYKMMQEAFDGRAPVCIRVDYDGSVIFMQSKDSNLVLPAKLLEDTGFQDATPRLANPDIRADVSTDDWPFFYMPKRIYPVSYLPMLGLVLAIPLLVTANFVAEKPRFSQLSFFFLGVGFMLVETKGITEMGLTFGNTWQVIGIVIASILFMAFLANCVVQWLKMKNSLVPYILLLASLSIGWFVAKGGGLSSTPMGRVATAVVLTCPMFFSGIVFSTLLASEGEISSIMAINLLGAMCGGLLEYNSMYFGFQFLYLLAMACYFLALVFPYMKLRQKRPAFRVNTEG
jgi:spermidine synthase